ncbi:MAG: hypothetical protein C5B49_00610, partial [Bdellovibrio sp.]
MAPDANSMMDNVVFETPVKNGASDVTVELKLGCFAPNLRAVPNPVAPTSELTLEMGIHPASDKTKVAVVRVNDRTVKPPPATDLLGWYFKPYYWNSTVSGVAGLPFQLDLNVTFDKNGSG